MKGARATPNYAKAEAALAIPFGEFVFAQTQIEVPAGNLNILLWQLAVHRWKFENVYVERKLASVNVHAKGDRVY